MLIKYIQKMVKLLMEACESDNVKIASDIVDLGADLSKTGTFSRVEFDRLCCEQNVNHLVIENVFCYFVGLNFDGEKTGLHISRELGTVRFVKKLLELSVDLILAFWIMVRKP